MSNLEEIRSIESAYRVPTASPPTGGVPPPASPLPERRPRLRPTPAEMASFLAGSNTRLAGAVTNPVLGTDSSAGQSNEALLGHSCQVPKA